MKNRFRKQSCAAALCLLLCLSAASCKSKKADTADPAPESAQTPVGAQITVEETDSFSYKVGETESSSDADDDAYAAADEQSASSPIEASDEARTAERSGEAETEPDAFPDQASARQGDYPEADSSIKHDFSGKGSTAQESDSGEGSTKKTASSGEDSTTQAADSAEGSSSQDASSSGEDSTAQMADSAEGSTSQDASSAGASSTQDAEPSAKKRRSVVHKDWQGTAVFPDWKGYTDDTLAMNSMYSFFGYHGQGSLFVETAPELTGLQLYVNSVPVDTSVMTGGKSYTIDISSVTVDGTNTIQVTGIMPQGLAEAVTVHVPYPVILPGTPEEEGISAKALDMISELVSADIDHGFPSAQLAVIRNGRLVYENAWGKTNSYLPDGTPDLDSPDVTTSTLYDLASVTKMFSVNYALQKLVSDGLIDLDARITEFLGQDFVDSTILAYNEKGEYPEEDLKTIKSWKKKLTVRDLLRHQGGFPADPKYSSPLLYRDDLKEGEALLENPLFAGNEPGEETRKATVEMICRTPLIYQPGTKTVYSDVDYMVLGLVVEQITGESLDDWLKANFWDPMNLTHITYNPLREGFSKDECAATELNGNTRDNFLNFEGYRDYTLQGEVHDEKAFYCMDGVSGHAGLFADAEDAAKLASVMICGGYGEYRFFSKNAMDFFTAPKAPDAGNWGLGWQRQGDGQRVWYFGTQSSSGAIGHQGWTGTLFLVDPSRNLVVVYLTNEKNTRVTNPAKNANVFDGDYYTSCTLGFVPQILSIGMDSDLDISRQLLDLSAEMALESLKLLPKEQDDADAADTSETGETAAAAETGEAAKASDEASGLTEDSGEADGITEDSDEGMASGKGGITEDTDERAASGKETGATEASGRGGSTEASNEEDDSSEPSAPHPSVKNAQSKYDLFERMAEKSSDEAHAQALREALVAAYESAGVPLNP